VEVLIKLFAAIFGLAAGIIATMVIAALFVAGVCLLLLFTPVAAVAVAFGSKRASEYSGAFRALIEKCLEKVTEVWGSIAGNVFS
jgi:hypothetical protein